MKIFKLTLFVSLIVISISCEKEFKETAEVFFSGITNRDENNELNGFVDSTDWQLNTVFSSRENGLFNADNLPICGDATDTVYKVYSYPNPSNGVFVFGSITPMDSISIRIVDDNYEILYQKDGLTIPSLSIVENGDGGSRLVRMYYRIYYESCKYQGYGDLSIR